jgi:hypothetical protein
MLDECVTDRGSVRLSRPARGVVHTVITGYANLEIADRIIDWVDRAIADGERPQVFHDWDAATGYEPRVRPRLATWYARIRKNVASVHVFTRSKVVSMGVALVSIAMNNSIVAYQERRPFEVELAAAIKAAH